MKTIELSDDSFILIKDIINVGRQQPWGMAVLLSQPQEAFIIRRERLANDIAEAERGEAL